MNIEAKKTPKNEEFSFFYALYQHFEKCEKAEQWKTEYIEHFRKVHGPVARMEAVVHHLRAVRSKMDGVLSQTLEHLIFLSKFFLFFLGQFSLRFTNLKGEK